MSKHRDDTIMTLGRAGYTLQEARALIRQSARLHTWAERECNGEIQRDETTGIPYWHSSVTGKRLGRVPDAESGALKLARGIAAAHDMTIYHQGDPRGCCLWILRPGDVPKGGDVDGYYSRGIAVVP